MQAPSTEKAETSSTPPSQTPPEDPLPFRLLSEAHLLVRLDESIHAGAAGGATEDNNEEGGGQSSGVDSAHNCGHSSGHMADEEGQSSAAQSEHSDVGRGMKSSSSSSIFGTSRTRVLCNLHQHKAAIRRPRMITVACQTEETQEFGPLIIDSTEDPSCSDGTLRLMIQNFRSMADTVRGPTKRIQNVSWRIMVMPRQHVVQKKGTQKCLGFFLQCCPDAYSDAWSCQAAAELRLISQKPGVPHFTRKTNHVYTAKENDWGYSCFMTWADILDEAQGYIKDDRVVLEVTVKADPPKNIVGLEEFRKTVQSWFDLADLQFRRGKIDLAIEANAQGLKYCKDRDNECLRKLEEQKAYFIDTKVVESIARIESAQKKRTTGDTNVEVDPVSNQNALRMALTSNNHSRSKNSKNKKFMKNSRPRAPTPNTQPKVTTNKAVKTENAKTVQQGNDTSEESEVSKLRKSLKSGERSVQQALNDGSFNTGLFVSFLPSWVRRSKLEDDMYTDVAIHLGEVVDSHVRDSYVTKFMTEQLRSVYFPGDNKDEKESLFSFAETAFDVEMQRQNIIKKACLDAEEFTRKHTSEKETEEKSEYEIFDWDLKLLWENGKALKRADTIDREANFLDGKIRLFWDALGSMKKLRVFDSCSDHSSSSRESNDRETDGCLKAKRTKVEGFCEECINISRRMTDNEVQTDVNANNPTPTIDEDGKVHMEELFARNNERTRRDKERKTTRTNGEEAEQPYDSESDYEPESPDYSMIGPFSPTCSPPSFMGDLSTLPSTGQIVNALSTLAMNVTNTRRIIHTTEEIIMLIETKQSEDTIRYVLRDLSKLAGIVFVEKEEKPPTVPVQLEEFVEDDFATLYSKLLNSDNKEEIIMSRQLEKMAQYKTVLKSFMFLDQEDVDRLLKCVNAFSNKIKDNEKKSKDLQKKQEQLEAKNKKLESTMREEVSKAKQDYTQERERNTQLNRDLKEKNRTIKQLENRCSSLQSEKDDAQDKNKQLQKELQGVQKRVNEDSQKSKREISQLNEQKRQLQNSLNSVTTENKTNSAQVAEKSKEIKKLKEELAAEKNKVKQLTEASNAHQERAKKSEIALLQHQWDAGLAVLERAKVDATKKRKEMDDAASNRARSANEVSLCIQSRDEWARIIEEIDQSIKKTNEEYEHQMEAINNGKALASLPVISVPKPPPPPQLIKVAPIAPVEPTKPGVIGSKPQNNNSNTNNNNNTSNVAPIGRPTSPQEGSPSSSNNVSAESPRHAPIGTRPNGTVVNGCSAESESSNNNPWTWSDPLSAITDTIHPSKRLGAEERNTGLFSNDLFGNLNSIGTSSVWNCEDQWSTAFSSLGSTVMGSSSPSFLNPINLQNPAVGSQQSSQQSAGQTQTPGSQQNMSNTQSMTPSSASYLSAMQQQQHQQSQQNLVYSQPGWGNISEMQRQYFYRQHQQYQQNLAVISKKIGMDFEKTNELVNDFCREHKVHYQNITGEDSVVEKIREYYNKRLHALRISAPPGAAPGYLANPLVSVMDRASYNFMGDHHPMNDRAGGVPGIDKW